jgi:hypothetical protein
VHGFDVRFLTRLYEFPGNYQGGTFCSSTTEWHFLDGGIISRNGYGWGSHSWTVVEGAEAVRGVCMFFGIQQPLTIRGESPDAVEDASDRRSSTRSRRTSAANTYCGHRADAGAVHSIISGHTSFRPVAWLILPHPKRHHMKGGITSGVVATISTPALSRHGNIRQFAHRPGRAVVLCKT